MSTDTRVWPGLQIESRKRVGIVEITGKSVRSLALAYRFIGLLACILILAQAGESRPGRFLLYLVCANLAALALKLTSSRNLLPAGFLFLLLRIEDLSLPELLFIAISITLFRELRSVRRLSDIPRLLYIVASVTIGVTLAQMTYGIASQAAFGAIWPAIVASSFVLIINCSLAAALLTKPTDPFLGMYRSEWRSLLPWFVATAGLAYLVQCAGFQTGYHPALIALPILFTLERGYRTWSEAIAGRKEELAQLHRNTLETLAVAIDARDQTTHMHLQRVQIYALAVGRELSLSEPELEALNVAAMLHDIGKLAIPDYILLKPGSLTPEEWEKMKTHAVIGAEMLSRMRFPDLVSAIVKTHHEKWDGTGYPHSLSGTKIPVGARILSAVDCLDALASDRPYRPALSLENAMAMVRNQAGLSYDPAIIAILERRYVELEQLAREAVGSAPVNPTASSQAGTQKGSANFTNRPLAESKAATKSDILAPIVSARQETQLLRALGFDLAHSANLDEVVPAIHRCLSQMIGYDTLGVYVRRQDQLEPIYFLGGHDSLFTKETFPITKGLSGWVLQHGKPILNGNVSLECCYSNNSLVLTNLQTAIAVRFESRGGTTGVITLYHLDPDAFSRDDLRILEAASSQIGPAIEGALKFQNAEESAATDHLTGVPNARALAIHLGRELQRAGRDQSTVGVLVCDLDGFKQVNDRFGHLMGNEVLQHVAKGLREACRGSDYLARMGGDEFVIVLPGLQGDYSSHLERLRAVAVGAGQTICGEPCLSMSVGLAVFPFDGCDAETLIEEADRRMYRLKHQSKSERGQNGASFDDPIQESPLSGLVRVLRDAQERPGR